jgi:hypothetical protein
VGEVQQVVACRCGLGWHASDSQVAPNPQGP